MGWFVDGVDSAEKDEWQEEVQAEGENSEVRKPRRKPTKKEVEEHEVTHLPYRNWCWACVQGRTWTSCSWAQRTSLGRPFRAW